MNEKNEQRIFNSKNKSVTIKGTKRIHVPVKCWILAQTTKQKC